jgi:hypothetical protein
MRHCCKISLQQNGGTKKQKTKRKEQRMIVSMYSRQTRVDCDVSKRYNNRRSLPPKCILSCDPLYTFCRFCFLSYQSPLARCCASNRISLLGTRTCRGCNERYDVELIRRLLASLASLLRAFVAEWHGLWVLVNSEGFECRAGGSGEMLGERGRVGSWPRSGGGIRWYLTAIFRFSNCRKLTIDKRWKLCSLSNLDAVVAADLETGGFLESRPSKRDGIPEP